MQTALLLLIGAWIAFPLIVYAVNMSLPKRAPAFVLFLPVVAILCVPGCYQTYSIGLHNDAYRKKMAELEQRLDRDGDGSVRGIEVTPEFTEAQSSQPPINCVMPLEFVYVPASFAWCTVCFAIMCAMESAAAWSAKKACID